MRSAAYNYNRCKISDLTHGHTNYVSKTIRDFPVSDLDGWIKPISHLSNRGYIVETGSTSCPFFNHNRAAMDQLALDHPQFDFFVLYTREAHPDLQLKSHRTMTEKLDLAHELQGQVSVRRRVIFEDLKGSAHQWLGGLPNSLTFIENRRVVLHLAWNNPEQLAYYLAEFKGQQQELRLDNLPSFKNVLSALANADFKTRIHYGMAMLRMHIKQWIGKHPRYSYLLRGKKLEERQSRAS